MIGSTYVNLRVRYSYSKGVVEELKIHRNDFNEWCDVYFVLNICIRLHHISIVCDLI